MKPREPLTYPQALQYALRLLNQRSYSEAMLLQKLRYRLVSESDSLAVVTELKRLKLIDDVKYAQNLIRSEANYNHTSTQRIRQKLRQKGLASTIIESELKDEEAETENEEERIRYHATRYLRRHPEPDRQKFAGYLYRKGFSGSLIARTIRDTLHNPSNSL